MHIVIFKADLAAV